MEAIATQLCKHNRENFDCKTCKYYCEHQRLKYRCKECGGSGICEHQKRRSECKECGGSSICEHHRRRTECKECEPTKYLVNLQRRQIYRIMQQTDIEKTQPSIEYLGCSALYFREYISKKMTADMNWNNIHYDHIKPVSKFNLNDPDELLKCCHYTNFQPLLSADNLEKSNKWNDETELFWNENICGK